MGQYKLQFYAKYYFAPNTCTEFGRMVDGHGKWSITKSHSHWSNGGATVFN